MGRRKVLLVGACVLAMVGCSNEAGTGSISGTVRGFGGPAVVVHGHTRSAIQGAPMAAQVVTVARGGKVIARITTGKDGTYRISVPVGTYAVSAACSTPAQVRVHRDRTARVSLRCDFP